MLPIIQLASPRVINVIISAIIVQTTRSYSKDASTPTYAYQIHLGDNAEVHAGEAIGLHTLKGPPEWRGIGHIGGLHLTRTASKHATNTATDISNC